LCAATPAAYARIMDNALFVGVGMVLPLVSLVCLAMGVWRRGQCPTWLLAVAVVPPICFAFAAHVVFTNFIVVAVPVWMAVSVGLLLVAVAAARRGWPVRRASALLGLAVPVPLMAFTLFLAVLLGTHPFDM
jgi:hypothetical protein